MKYILLFSLILLTACSSETNLIDKIMERQISDTKEFLEKNSEWDNSAVLQHILYLINDYEIKYGNKYEEDKKHFTEKLVLILETNEDILVKINSLDVLSRGNYDVGFLNKLSEEIIQEQEQDGSWRHEEFNAPVFLTFRAVIALNYFDSEKYNKNIENGLVFLDNSYENYNYDDEYLQFIYLGEDLDCVENCNLTYRLMDAYFNVYFIKNEFNNYEIIQKQVDDADLVFNYIIEEWRKGEIYNARKSKSKEGFALDTYCIFAYATEDKEMEKTILRYLDKDNWKVDKETVGSDYWRYIADETWCARALIRI